MEYDNLFEWLFKTSVKAFYDLIDQAGNVMDVLSAPISSLLPDGWLSQVISKLVDWFLPGVSLLEILFLNITLIITVTVVKWLKSWT